MHYIPNQLTARKVTRRRQPKDTTNKPRKAKQIKEPPIGRPIFIYINDGSNHPRFTLYFDMS